MPTTVNEVSGNPRTMVTGFLSDNHLVFPNVQTCVAVIGLGGPGAQLMGVHMTIGEKNPSQAFRHLFDDKFSGCTKLFLVGGISIGGWTNASLRAAVGTRINNVVYSDTSEWIDKSNASGGVTVNAVGAGSDVAVSVVKGDGQAAKSINSFSKL